MTNIVRQREMALTSELLRRAVDRHPKLRPLRDGRRFMLGYGPNGVWLSVAGVRVVTVPLDRWWDAGLDTREDRAIQMAAQLARAASRSSTYRETPNAADPR